MNTAPSTSMAATAVTPASGSPAGAPSSVPNERDRDTHWYFTSEELANSPSRRHGIDSDVELSYRQMTAYLIQEMGQRLKVSQLCINTAIVYMHRFYAFHSFTHFHRNAIASASLFLAAKVEEQPRKLEHVIRAANKCLNQPTSNNTDALYVEQAQDLVFNENVLLQTLGFDVAIDHPHTHVVKTCHLVKACKDLTKTSYFLASNSLHLTSMCLQYRPTVVACFCIYLACKWSRWEIPQSTEGKHWFHYVDKTVTMELLKQLTDEFIAIYEKSPARLKSKLNSIKALAQGAGGNRAVNKDKKMPAEDWKMSDIMKMYHSSINICENSNQSSGSGEHQQQLSPHMTAPPMLPPSTQQQQQPQQQQQSMQMQQQPLQQQQQQQQQPMTQAQAQQNQHQQMRKSDIHSSQHRPHHHGKHGFTPVGDMTYINDHKTSYKNQQQPGYNNANPQATAYSGSGRIRDHSQAQQTSSLVPPSVGTANQPPRSNASLSSSSRSSISNASLQAPPRQQQQVPSGMQLDSSHSYQKIRDRSSSMHAIASGGVHNSMPAHKLPSSKGDSTSRSMMATKEPKHKLFANTAGALGMREFGSGQLSSQGSSTHVPATSSSNSSGSKLDPTHELTRGMLQHQQRSFAGNNNLPLANPVLGNLGFNMPQPPPTQHRQPNANVPSNNINSGVSVKIEHNKTMPPASTASAVHMQSQLHKSTSQDSSNISSNAPPTTAYDLQQQLYPGHTFSSLLRNDSFDNVLDDDPLPTLHLFSSTNPPHGMLPLGQQQQQSQPMTQSQLKSSTSLNLFGSAEGGGDSSSNKVQPFVMGMPGNAFAGVTTLSETNGSHRLAANSIKSEITSPKHNNQSAREKDRERIKVSPSTKKEKHRHAAAAAAASATTSAPSFAGGLDANAGLGPSSMGQHKAMQYIFKKSDVGNEQPTAVNASAGNKRHHVVIKQEDDVQREKTRKLDTMALTASNLALHSESKAGDLSKLVNGIETNPDLVRSLLKESLCTSNALIKTEALLSVPDSKPPAELFATPFDKDDASVSKATVETLKASAAEGQTTAASDEAETSETKDRDKHKKNKKDKHKHKEKDKVKDRDREERKKHKKDKDRHKEKERDRDTARISHGDAGRDRTTENVEPFKIKIRKDVFENSASSSTLNPPPLKIKIPTDRIIGSLGGGGNSSSNSTTTSHHIATSSSAGAIGTNNASNTVAEQKPHNTTLKIKISKDKIEGYSGGSYHPHRVSTTIAAPAASTTSFAAPHEQPSNTSFYTSYYAPQTTTLSGTGSTTTGGAHTHSHHSSGGGSSKKKDRDRDRSRDHERDKKRHCGDSSRSGGGTIGGGTASTSASSSHSYGGGGNSSGTGQSSRNHSSNKH